MNRRISAPKIPVLFFVALFALIVSAFAYSVPDDTIVYVTPSGSKYHREDCSYTTSVRPMTIKEAERKGYDACSRCDPDKLTGEYHSNWDGKSGSNGMSGGSTSNRPQNNTITTESKPTETVVESENKTSIGTIIITGIAHLTLGFYALLLIPTVLAALIGVYNSVASAVKKIIKRK